MLRALTKNTSSRVLNDFSAISPRETLALVQAAHKSDTGTMVRTIQPEHELRRLSHGSQERVSASLFVSNAVQETYYHNGSPAFLVLEPDCVHAVCARDAYTVAGTLVGKQNTKLSEPDAKLALQNLAQAIRKHGADALPRSGGLFTRTHQINECVVSYKAESIQALAMKLHHHRSIRDYLESIEQRFQTLDDKPFTQLELMDITSNLCAVFDLIYSHIELARLGQTPPELLCYRQGEFAPLGLEESDVRYAMDLYNWLTTQPLLYNISASDCHYGVLERLNNSAQFLETAGVNTAEKTAHKYFGTAGYIAVCAARLFTPSVAKNAEPQLIMSDAIDRLAPPRFMA